MRVPSSLDELSKELERKLKSLSDDELQKVIGAILAAEPKFFRELAGQQLATAEISGFTTLLVRYLARSYGKPVVHLEPSVGFVAPGFEDSFFSAPDSSGGSFSVLPSPPSERLLDTSSLEQLPWLKRILDGPQDAREPKMDKESKADTGEPVSLPSEPEPRPDEEYADQTREKAAQPPRPCGQGVKRVVSTGLAAEAKPTAPLSALKSLPPQANFWFWFEVAPERIPGDIGRQEVGLSQVVSDGAQLEVQLWATSSGPEVSEKIGRLNLRGDRGEVLEPADEPVDLDPAIAGRRLFFRVRTPKRVGDHWFRASVYSKGTLVQSFRVTLLVESRPEIHDDPVLVRDLEYVLTHELDDNELDAIGSHTVSLTHADADDPGGTHTFRFVGGSTLRATTTIEGHAVQEALDRARRAFRIASWGDDRVYDPDHPQAFTYRARRNFAELERDTIELAAAGHNLWLALMSRLVPRKNDGRRERDEIARTMEAAGGRIQLALRQAASSVLPIALFYDHPLDIPLKAVGGLSLCDAYRRAPMPLDSPCFGTGCPNRQASNIVCPSGFWGFRHEIGLPPSRGPKAHHGVVGRAEDFVIHAAAWAEPDFKHRDHHLFALNRKFGAGYRQALSRAETQRLLCDGRAHLVYFYCHGHSSPDGDPQILVGNAEEPAIEPSTFNAWGVAFEDPAPLVVINGCHTADLAPERLIHFVDELVQHAGACGVIGTEITVFEELAVRFAELFLEAFARGLNVGQAVRHTRLTMLGEDLNPLGLVYVPYVLASTRLEASRPA